MIRTISATIASPGRAAGRVHHVQKHDDIYGCQPGSILVARIFSITFVPNIKQVGAVITCGCLTCHLALISREHKVPCLLCSEEELLTIKHGARVEVDAERGIVKILDTE